MDIPTHSHFCYDRVLMVKFAFYIVRVFVLFFRKVVNDCTYAMKLGSVWIM